MLRQSQIVIIPEREVLFLQGDEGRAVLVLLVGFVKLSSVTSGGREVVLEICGPGSLFGELAVLNGWTRIADALALSRCEVLSIAGGAFRATLAQSPDAMFAMFGVLSRRLRFADEQIRDSASLPGAARLAKAMSQLAAAHARPVKSGLQLEIALSQRELGGMTGLSRESINKELALWRGRGWIEMSHQHITIRAAEALRSLVREAEVG